MVSPLSSELSRWFGRAVIVARGAEDARAQGERALALGDATGALTHAREVLLRVPRSPVGLALAADAAEAGWLDEDAARYLDELSAVVPWQPEVWLRLGLARLRLGVDRALVVEALSRATTFAEAPAVVARAAIALADLDLEARDAVRALAWLDRAAAAAPSPAVAVRRALALLERNEVDAAKRALAAMGGAPDPLDGIAALVTARLAPDGRATAAYLRALILDAPGAEAAFARSLSLDEGPLPDEVVDVLTAKGLLEKPLFRAAVAQRRGDRDKARAALREAADGGDQDAARALVRAAMLDEDGVALEAALSALPVEEAKEARAVCAAVRDLDRDDPVAALAALDRAGQHPFAAKLRARAMFRWVPPPEEGALVVPAVVTELRRAARTLDETATLLGTEELLTVSQRPLRVAILGEFNAGKSTFLNAFLGADIAPMGVLPTTATLHHVVYSQDRFARIHVVGDDDRVVDPARLRQTLQEVQDAGGSVSRVTVGLPLDRLRQVEILDTPGFNAPDVTHAEAARKAFLEANLLLWIMDANQPLKDSEKRVLAEAAPRGVPVLLLGNKSDRLTPKQRDEILAYVGESLGRIGIAPIAEVALVSARLALAGRLGDAEALEKSSWEAVEAILDRDVVARAPEWKDRALRRRARALVGPLRTRAATLAEGELQAVRALAERSACLAEAATFLRSRPVSVARAVERALEGPRRALVDDLAPLPEGGEGERASRAYAAHRAVHRLAPALAEGLSSALPSLARYRDDVTPRLAKGCFAALHGLLHGLASVRLVTSLPTADLLEATAEPVAVLLEDLAGTLPHAVPFAAPLALRLEALEDALGGPLPAPGETPP